MWNVITAVSGSNLNLSEDRVSISLSPSSTEAAKRPQILIVDDNRADVFLIREAIQAAHVDADLHVAPDGQAAVRFLSAADEDRNAPIPDLILLDLNLPKIGGENVLKHLRNTDRCSNTRVLVLTSSDFIRERERVTELGISGYFRKPSEYSEFIKLGALIKEVLETPANPG